MDILETILSVATLVSTLGAFIYVGRKLQILDSLQRTTETIKANLKVVTDHLIATNKDFDHTGLQDYSPLHLTKRGRSLIDELDFRQVFQAHKADF